MPNDLAGMLGDLDMALKRMEQELSSMKRAIHPAKHMPLTDTEAKEVLDALCGIEPTLKPPIQFENGSPYRSAPIVPNVRGKKSILRRMKDWMR